MTSFRVRVSVIGGLVGIAFACGAALLADWLSESIQLGMPFEFAAGIVVAYTAIALGYACAYTRICR